jgi:hypothetical protein
MFHNDDVKEQWQTLKSMALQLNEKMQVCGIVSFTRHIQFKPLSWGTVQPE